MNLCYQFFCLLYLFCDITTRVKTFKYHNAIKRYENGGTLNCSSSNNCICRIAACSESNFTTSWYLLGADVANTSSFILLVVPKILVPASLGQGENSPRNELENPNAKRSLRLRVSSRFWSCENLFWESAFAPIILVLCRITCAQGTSTIKPPWHPKHEPCLRMRTPLWP
jgi:hypothetical protein